MTLFSKILQNLYNFQSLEVVDRVSETQLEVGEISNWIIWRLKGWDNETIKLKSQNIRELVVTHPQYQKCLCLWEHIFYFDLSRGCAQGKVIFQGTYQSISKDKQTMSFITKSMNESIATLADRRESVLPITKVSYTNITYSSETIFYN